MKQIIIYCVGAMFVMFLAANVLADDSNLLFGDKTVKDRTTSLTWTRDAKLGKHTWGGALELVKDLNDKNYGGYNDWRIPTTTEFNTLTNQANDPVRYSEQDKIYINLKAMGFINVQPYNYWSVWPTYSMRSTFSYINMETGHQKYIGDNNYVWPVRGGVTSSGILKNDRFIFSDKTVEDTLSYLIWARNANLGNGDYFQAKNIVMELNKNNYAGHNDWRLPTINEFEALLYYLKLIGNDDASISSGAYNLLNNIGFYNIKDSSYWSRDYIKDKSYLSINMRSGLSGSNSSKKVNSVWPVSGSVLRSPFNVDTNYNFSINSRNQ